MASKIAERIYLDAFIKIVGWSVDEIAETEAPDFVLTVAGRELGVEVRQVFKEEGRKGSPIRRDERERAEFLVEAARQYYALGGRPIYVKVLTRGPWYLGEPGAFARRLLTAVLGAEFKDVEVGQPWAPDEPHAVVMPLPSAAGPYSRWLCVGDSVGWVRQVAWTDVEAFVREKATRLDAYRERVNDVVLLLVAARSSESSMLQYADAEMSGESLGFSAVYWHEHLIRSIRIA